MDQDTIERSEHKHSHVIVQNGREKDSPIMNDSLGVRRENIAVKLYHCV